MRLEKWRLLAAVLLYLRTISLRVRTRLHSQSRVSGRTPHSRAGSLLTEDGDGRTKASATACHSMSGLFGSVQCSRPRARRRLSDVERIVFRQMISRCLIVSQLLCADTHHMQIKS